MSDFSSISKPPSNQPSKPAEAQLRLRLTVDSFFESGSLADWPQRLPATLGERPQDRNAATPLDRGNRRRRIRGKDLVLKRPKPLKLLSHHDEEPELPQPAGCMVTTIEAPGRLVNEENLNKIDCSDELLDDTAVHTPSTSTDSPLSSKEGAIACSMLECLLFELSSSSSASECGDADEVLLDGFISDDDDDE
ncbi:hypothetical protein FOL47_000340 [Perkinsus chesapeaki]|uniref:Uncharacterized protein n=1 Tax=Perkinsus chesapeaki TaxID=330153 RepID=A0A7J6MLW4_PERCH|nr:hypothetical protein FOL47_000340 [Perkinsus chesapeaki]